MPDTPPGTMLMRNQEQHIRQPVTADPIAITTTSRNVKPEILTVHASLAEVIRVVGFRVSGFGPDSRTPYPEPRLPAFGI